MARTAKDVYAQYRIMPSLQLHQFRVAATAKMVCENIEKQVRKRDVILACLFHDMGNILKFDLEYFPEFLKPEGLKYWNDVKEEYKKKYGAEQHEASKKIAEEIGLAPSVIGYIDATGFSKVNEALSSPSYEKKICEYADARVGPFGVLPLEQRLLDARKRYVSRSAMKESGASSTLEEFNTLLESERKLEEQIFTYTKMKPEDITDDATREGIQELMHYPV